MEITTPLTTLLENYVPSQATVDIVKSTPLVLLVGISGAGKGTIRNELTKTGDYTNFTSHTTRKPRENNGVMERDGMEYYFITLEKAVEMLQGGEFVEAKYYSGNVYGTTAAELVKARESGKIALNDIEAQGVGEYLDMSPETKVIFIVPPTYEIWLKRLAARYQGEINWDDLGLRLETAKRELETALKDKRYRFIINDVLEIAVRDVDAIAKNHSYDDQPARKVAQAILDCLSSENRETLTRDILTSA